MADFRLHRETRTLWKTGGGVWGGCGHLDRCCLGPVQDLRCHRRSAVEATRQRVLCLFMQHVDGWMCCERLSRGLTNVIGMRRRADGAARESLGIPRSAAESFSQCYVNLGPEPDKRVSVGRSLA